MNLLLAFLVGKDIIYRTNLSETISGNYWIYNNEGKKILNIENRSGKWCAISGNEAQLINTQMVNINQKEISVRNAMVKEIYIEKFGTYFVHVRNFEVLFVLYLAPNYEDYIKLDLKDSSGILIGNGVRKPYSI